MSEPSMMETAAEVAAGGAGFGGAFAAFWWLINWFTGRADKRQAVLDAQEEKVDQDWRAIREELHAANAATNRKLAAIEKQNEALRFAFHHVAGALIRIDPKNPALVQAEQLLAQAFPIDFGMLAARAEAALDQVAADRATIDD